TELTKSLLSQIEDGVDAGRDSEVLTLVADLHASDIGAVLDHLGLEQARYLLRLLEPGAAAEAVVELDEAFRERLLEGLTSQEIAEKLIEYIDSDDAADVMADLPEEKAKEILDLLEDEAQADDIEELLRYEEGTAGALMGKELVKVRTDWSVARAIIEMRRQAAEVEHVYTIYVVDKDERLWGLLSLKDLLFAAESTRTLIKHIAEEDAVSVTADTDVEEVVKRMKKFDVVVLPVVSEEGHLLGRITFDDVMDVMDEEATEDYQLASGISEDVDAMDSPWVQTRARLPWLLIGIAGGILSSQIIGLYEHQLRIDPRMAFFMPLIAATAGNVGVQSSAIVVQGLAAGTMTNMRFLPRLWKELRVAMISALVCGSLIFAVNFILREGQALSYTVSIALFTVILFAALFGTMIPLLLDRLKVDPALATGPFVTTLNDIFGLLMYFTVGHFMYDQFP
ncbi:MAG: magnesium transporter, partial [Flavobacteriales bacterium]|nr:magnesium transporter [Flavobacteriales bacterium]